MLYINTFVLRKRDNNKRLIETNTKKKKKNIMFSFCFLIINQLENIFLNYNKKKIYFCTFCICPNKFYDSNNTKKIKHTHKKIKIN
ncbi:hypothetical protein PFUGPA_05754 [Plasmodium falciparum Palo Alto/Uganda]|uniref:Uncharacterized protein n=3 Tax=Plasmodium falciparum TaxID=5833 RepID=W4IQX3_PLAFP|nr:hypothetical protein PFFVO_00553 [Plasmodium falciparum Vietnam Oak-Knoll (FVO)]ETW44991.1 hypothetical protein PFNF135_00593 [Plasmodium falciparum NF135/5.C10]ETW52139.1 hypothetical protein PFUGPA_05754 [Plasmodium falciparum Palo Alto/Uganda]